MSEQKLNSDILTRAKKIKLLLMDCDGVLTDGRLYYSDSGEAQKVFHVRDGQGLVDWHCAGFQSGIITGRNSKILETRANELGITYLKQASKDKAIDLEEVLAAAGFQSFEAAFVGDDLVDLAVFEKVGFSIAVNDAVKELKERADHVTSLNGGFGAVREVIDLLLFSKNKSL